MGRRKKQVPVKRFESTIWRYFNDQYKMYIHFNQKFDFKESLKIINNLLKEIKRDVTGYYMKRIKRQLTIIGIDIIAKNKDQSKIINNKIEKL